MKTFWKHFGEFLLFLIIFALCFCSIYFSYINSGRKEDKLPSDTSTNAVVQMQEQINQLNENIDNMMIVLTDKEMTIQVMSVELDDCYGEINSQKRAMDVLCDEIDAKNLTIAQLEQDKAEQQAKFDELSQEVIANAEEIEKVKVKLEEISTELAQEKVDLNNLEIKVDKIESKVAELEEKVIKTETDIETIKEDIVIIKVNIENIQEQIEGLQTSIDNLTSKVLTVTYQWISGTEGVLIYSNGVMETWGKIVQWFNDNQVYYFSLPNGATYGNTIWNISISVYGVEECSTLNVEITSSNQFYLQNQRYANVNDHMGVYYRTIGIKT